MHALSTLIDYMNQKLSTILEVVSAAAVVLSLVFVGLEIRNSAKQTEQNTQALAVSAYQDLIGRIVDINTIGITESQTIDSLLALESPTPQEIDKLDSFLWILLRHGDMAYYQFEIGSISKERMHSAMAPLLLRLNYTRVSQRWNSVKDAFVPSYRNFIDSYIESITTKYGDSKTLR